MADYQDYNYYDPFDFSMRGASKPIGSFFPAANSLSKYLQQGGLGSYLAGGNTSPTAGSIHQPGAVDNLFYEGRLPGQPTPSPTPTKPTAQYYNQQGNLVTGSGNQSRPPIYDPKTGQMLHPGLIDARAPVLFGGALSAPSLTPTAQFNAQFQPQLASAGTQRYAPPAPTPAPPPPSTATPPSEDWKKYFG